MKLVRPSIKFAKIFSKALEEGPIVHMGLTDKDSFTKENFDESPEYYFQTLNEIENGDIETPSGIILKLDYYKFYWMIDNDKFIGCCSLRSSTDPETKHYLDHNTGHFGQSIVKSMRSQGYGSQQWELAKVKLKSLGLDYAVRGAHPDNIASWKGIERTGGKFFHDADDDLGWGISKMYKLKL